MIHGKAQLAQKHHDKPKIKSNDLWKSLIKSKNCGSVQIKSNDPWQTLINSKSTW